MNIQDVKGEFPKFVGDPMEFDRSCREELEKAGITVLVDRKPVAMGGKGTYGVQWLTAGDPQETAQAYQYFRWHDGFWVVDGLVAIEILQQLSADEELEKSFLVKKRDQFVTFLESSEIWTQKSGAAGKWFVRGVVILDQSMLNALARVLRDQDYAD